MQIVQQEPGRLSYQATAGANKVVKAKPGVLHSIIVGKWVASGVIEVSDHASDGDGNIVIKITGAGTNIDSFPKVFPIEAKFDTGITADIANFTDVTFIYN